MISAEAEYWTEEIINASDDLEHFTSNHAHRQAIGDIFDETHHYGGKGAVVELGERTLEAVNDGCPPKADYIRKKALRIVVNEFDSDVEGARALVQSQNG